MTKRSSLADKAKLIREKLKHVHVGPLEAANLVMDIVNHWNLYEDEAGGKNSSEWVWDTFGRRKAWFANRAEAMKHLRKAGIVLIEHNTAVWVYKKFHDTPYWTRVISVGLTLHEAYRGRERPIEKQDLHRALNDDPELWSVLHTVKKNDTLCPSCKARIDDDKKLHEENQSLKILLREKAAQIASDAKELAELRAKDKAWKLYADHFVTTVDQFGTPASLAKAKVRTAAEGEFGAPFQESKM